MIPWYDSKLAIKIPPLKDMRNKKQLRLIGSYVTSY